MQNPSFCELPAAACCPDISSGRAPRDYGHVPVSGAHYPTPTQRPDAGVSTHMGAHGRLCVRVRIAGRRAASALLWSRNPLVSGGPETHRT